MEGTESEESSRKASIKWPVLAEKQAWKGDGQRPHQGTRTGSERRNPE